MQLMARGGPRAINVVSAYWDAAGNGRFFTRWSAIGSLPVAALLLAPVVAGRANGYGQGVVASLISWALLALPMLAVASAERRMRDHTARGVLVTVVLLVLAFARPALNDVVVAALFGGHPDGVWIARIGMNLVVAFGLFSLIAIITADYQQTRATADRLGLALGRLDAANQQVLSEERDARLFVRGIVAQLRAERDVMLAQRIDFDAVRGFSERVREASHRLEELAEASPPVPALWTPRTASASRRRGIERLQPTPLLWVGLVYVVMSVPFLLTIADVARVIAAAVMMVLIDLAAGAVLRILPASAVRARGSAFVPVWAVAGIATAALGHVLLPDAGAVVIVPIFAMPVAAIVLAFAIDTRRRAQADEIRSTRDLAHAAGDLADRVRRAQAPLRQAASALHGRVQGRCVIFAAHADESEPTAPEIEQFRIETDRALDEVLAPVGAGEIGTVGALRRMLAGWEPLMTLDTCIDDDAACAVERSDAAPVVAEVVNEALVNAVKHSGARAARIDITTDAAGDLHVRVASAGALPRAVMPVRPFAGRTLLYQEGADVVLESVVPAPALAAHA